MKLSRNYKFRLYPNQEQATFLEAWSDGLRTLWNVCNEQYLWALGRLHVYRPRVSKDMRKFMLPGTGLPGHQHKDPRCSQNKQMTEALKENPWLAAISCSARQKVTERLNKAWKRHWKDPLNAGQPRFKAAGRDFISIYLTRDCRASVSGGRKDGALVFETKRLRALGGPIRIVYDRPIPEDCDVSSWTIKRELDEWYAVAATSREVPEPVHPKAGAVGIDVGVKLLIADSNGRALENPRHGLALERRIARAQRSVDRKRNALRRANAKRRAAGIKPVRGSDAKNLAKAKLKLAKLKRLEARRRRHTVDVESRRYADDYCLVAVEDLNISGMVRSARGSVAKPGVNVAAKAALNRAISDSAWGGLFEKLQYKLAERGGSLVKVPARNTSRTCSECGHVDADSRKSQARFVCTSCGAEANADINAARNILARALEAE